MMVTRAFDVSVLGPPGAGKGTQAVRLASAFDLLHLSTGDLLRDEVARATFLGGEAQAFMSRGELVPDELIAKMVLRCLHSQQGYLGCAYDGYPRTVQQAHLLDGLLAELNRRLDVVLFLNVPDEELVVRNSGRRACQACGALYHVVSHPPAREGVCDACGGELAQRDDDREDVVRERLRAYRGNADQVLALFKGRGILRQVSGVGTQEEVYRRLREAIRSVKR